MIKNLVTLFVWQASQYFVPLVTLPYLTRVLGVEQYGVLAIATNFVGYFIVLTDWGFTLTATQQVAQNAANVLRLRQIFWDTIFAKMMLGVASIIIFVPLILLVPQLRSMAIVLLLTSIQVFANIFTVNWFLQGMEKMVPLTTASMIGRLLTIPATFAFVHKSADTSVAAAIQSVAMIVTALFSVLFASRIIALWPLDLNSGRAREQLSEGWHVFLSQAAVSLYVQSNVVVLGLIAGPAQAGLFNGADRLRRAVQALYAPVTMAVFPRINNLMTANREQALKLMLRLLILQGGFTFVLSLLMFTSARWITILVLGSKFTMAVPIVQWLAALPFLVGISNVLGIQMMLPLGMKREFSRIIALSGIVNIFLLFPLSHYFGAVGAAFSVVMTETSVTSLMAVILFKRRSVLLSGAL